MEQRREATPIESIVFSMMPNYKKLDESLGQYILRNIEDENDITLFISLDFLMSSIFSSYIEERLNYNQHENLVTGDLAIALCNLAAHYKFYLYTRHELNATIALYFSFTPPPVKLQANSDYRSKFYNRFTDPTKAHIKSYLASELELAFHILTRVQDTYLVNTGTIDPFAWPYVMLEEDMIPSKLVAIISNKDIDYQYAALNDVALLRVKGNNANLITRWGLINYLIKNAKGDTTEQKSYLKADHILYLLALSGDTEFNVPGLTKVGMLKATKAITKLIKEKGKLPADNPNLPSLLEEITLKDNEKELIEQSWACLIHHDYVLNLTEAEKTKVETQLIDIVSYHELEELSSNLINGNRLNLRMLLTGSNDS